MATRYEKQTACWRQSPLVNHRRIAYPMFVKVKTCFILFAVYFCGCAIFTGNHQPAEKNSTSQFINNKPISEIHYTLHIEKPQAKHVTVDIQMPCPKNHAPTFKVRKNYAALRGFDRFIANLVVKADGIAVPVLKEALDQWTIAAPTCNSIHLNYKVFLDHREAFASNDHPPGSNELPFVDSSHAFFLGYSVFLFPEDDVSLPIFFTIKAPQGWSPIGPWPSEQGRFVIGSDIETLLSNYFTVGSIKTVTENIEGMKVTIARLDDRGSETEKSFSELLLKLIRMSRTYFQRSPRTSFLIMVNDWNQKGMGGSVRRDSIVINVSPANEKEQTIPIAHLIAHEFFHTWECGSSKDESQLKWFQEGFTDYFAWMILRDTEILTYAAWLEQIQSIFDRASAVRKDAKEMSLLDAGKYFYDDKSARDFSYTAGAILAFISDRRLGKTDSTKSLLGFMRHFLNGFCLEHSDYKVEDILTEAEKYSGPTFSDTLKVLLNKTKFPTQEDITKETGCEWIKEKVNRPLLGIGWHSSNGEAFIDTVSSGSIAEKAGLQAGDRIKTINGILITGKTSFDLAMDKSQLPTAVEIERRGISKKVTVTPKWVEENKLKLSCNKNLSES